MKAKSKILLIYTLGIFFLSQGLVSYIASRYNINIYSSQILEEEFPSEDEESSETFSVKENDFLLSNNQNLRFNTSTRNELLLTRTISRTTFSPKKKVLPIFKNFLSFISVFRK